MNILITGANGQLGNQMRLLGATSNDHFIYTDVVSSEGLDTTMLDITNINNVRALCEAEQVDVIVNCAAYTNVDKAETDQTFCEVLNAEAPKNLAMVMQERGGLLVHISTDYVFGGDPYNTPCQEDQKGTPTGIYGLTKLHGEENIIASGCNHIILRTAWLYSAYGKNFVKTMINLTATKPMLNVVFDQVGTPTFAGDLADAIVSIIEDYKKEAANLSKNPYSKQGIYHFSNEGVCSWYDFTMKIAELAGNTDCDIRPCHSNEFPSPVKRPAFSVLDKTKVKQTFGLTIPYWTVSLRKCMAQLGALKTDL